MSCNAAHLSTTHFLSSLEFCDKPRLFARSSDVDRGTGDTEWSAPSDEVDIN
jgi:hypothetical protein